MPNTIIEHMATITQPVEVSVKVGMEIDSKGQKKPSVEIKTTKHLEAAVNIADDVDAMLTASLRRCIETVKKAMEA